MLKGRTRFAFLGVILGIVLIAVAAVYYMIGGAAEEPIEWNLTLIGKNQEEQVLSYQDVCKLKSEEANGGFFTTVGVVNGPYRVKGVELKNLCTLVGGISEGDGIMISATDGYSMVFDYKQLSGGIQTYDPVTLDEVPHEKQIVMLIYQQDGKKLTDSDGRPLRIAVVGSESLLTEGHNWVKWVNKIEVLDIE